MKALLKLMIILVLFCFISTLSIDTTKAGLVDWQETTYYVNNYAYYPDPDGWYKIGNTPWIDNSIDSYISSPIHSNWLGWFEFPDLESTRFPKNMTLQILARSELNNFNVTCGYRLDQQLSYYTAETTTFKLTTAYTWYNLTFANLNSINELNNFKISFKRPDLQSGVFIYIMKARLIIWHSPTTYYNFHGLLNEDTGQYEGPVYVTAFVQGYAPETFLVNGVTTQGFSDRPDYFLFNLGSTTREFHPHTDGRDDYADIYIFNGSNLYAYDVIYYDVADVLSQYPYAIVERKINGTWLTMEQHRLDYTRNTRFALNFGSYYRFSVRDHDIYIIGDVQAKTNPDIEITINPIRFTVAEYDKYIFVYNHVIGIATRSNDGTNIIVRYADSLAQTSSVTIYIRYMNNTVVSGFPQVFTDQVFSYTWPNADNETNYLVDIVVNHDRFGDFTYPYALDCVYAGTPLDLSFFGTSVGLDMTMLAPIFLLICVGGSFSSLNAHAGVVATCLVFALFCAVGWFNFGVNTGPIIAVVLSLAVIAAISHAKRTGVFST